MSGTLYLKKKNLGADALGLAVSCLLAALFTGLMMKYLPSMALPPLAVAAVGAACAYILFRYLYPIFTQAIGGSGTVEERPWTIKGDTLTVGGKSVSCSGIKTVHCWPNRDALGHSQGGMTVNIETPQGNILLRSVTEGDRLQDSLDSISELVSLLGFGNKLPEL